jgi:protein-disulfide isomerase
MEYNDKPWFKTWWGIIIIIFSALILFFMALSASYFVGEIKNARFKLSQTEPKLTGEQYKAADDNHFSLGPENAKITIVEFGDFACPHCEQSYSTVREITLKYKDDIKFIWRDYPAQLCSDVSALAGRCAGEQGLFWPMHDKLFQNQTTLTSLNLDTNQCSNDTKKKITEQIVNLANQIGADLTKFNGCLTQQKYLSQIQKDLSDGQTFSITGTPTYFINGYKIAGNIPLDIFIKIIEELKK